MNKLVLLIWIISLSDNHHNLESVQLLYIFFAIYRFLF